MNPEPPTWNQPPNPTSVFPPPPVKRKARKWWLWPVAGIVAAWVLVATYNAGWHDGQDTALTATRTAPAPVAAAPRTTTPTASVPATSAAPPTTTVPAAAAAPAVPPSPAPLPTGFGNGTFHIGVDVPAGRYRSTGAGAGTWGGCYWERSRDDSGELGSIIANDNFTGSASVSLKKGEFFKTSGGCTWSLQ